MLLRTFSGLLFVLLVRILKCLPHSYPFIYLLANLFMYLLLLILLFLNSLNVFYVPANLLTELIVIISLFAKSKGKWGEGGGEGLHHIHSNISSC